MNDFYWDASALVKRYVPETGPLLVNYLVLTTSDHRLLQAAQAEGLTTFHPETDSQTQLDALISGT